MAILSHAGAAGKCIQLLQGSEDPQKLRGVQFTLPSEGGGVPNSHSFMYPTGGVCVLEQNSLWIQAMPVCALQFLGIG